MAGEDLSDLGTEAPPITSAPSDSAEDLKTRIAGVESMGQEHPYTAVGPPTRHGDRAYGKYQVMGSNIPTWTQEALGSSMDPQGFLNDPDAQEAVAKHRLGKYLDQFGNFRDAASMWHSGVPYDRAVAEGRTDGHMTTKDYADRVAAGTPPPKSSGGEDFSDLGTSEPPTVSTSTTAIATTSSPTVPPTPKTKPQFSSPIPGEEQPTYEDEVMNFNRSLGLHEAHPAGRVLTAITRPALGVVRNLIEGASALPESKTFGEGAHALGKIVGGKEPGLLTYPAELLGGTAQEATLAATGSPEAAAAVGAPVYAATSLAIPGGETPPLKAVAGAEEVAAATKAAPEAAAAARRVAGAAPGTEAAATAAPKAAETVLAPSGATTTGVGSTVKEALERRFGTLKDQAGSIYDAGVANAEASGKTLDPTEIPALVDHLKGVREELGTLPEAAEAAVKNLETKAAKGDLITATDLNNYKAAVDSAFPGKMKSGTEVRGWLRSLFSPEDREWAKAADALWRDELVGRGMTETSLGNLTKLIKKSDPEAVVEKLFGTGTKDRQGAIAKSVLKHLEVESPETAKALREAVFNRTVREASGTDNFGQSLLKTYDTFNPLFKSAIGSTETNTFFTVLKQEMTKPTPGRLATWSGRGLSIASHALGAILGSAAGQEVGHPWIGASIGGAALHIPPSVFAKALTDPRSANLLTRLIRTPANSAVVPALIKQLYNVGLFGKGNKPE